MGQSSIRLIVPTTNKIKIIKNKIPIAIGQLPFCSSHIMHPNFFDNQKQSSSNKLKSTIKSSFSNTKPFSISRYSSIDLGLVVHPNPRSSGQFFIARTNLFKLLIPSQEHFKLVMTLLILKTLLVSIYGPTMPMNCHAKYEIFGKGYSCFTHQVEGLNAFVSFIVLFEN